MKPNPVHRLPAPLEAAVQAIKLAARAAVERTIESLGLAALASTSVFQRDGLLGAQFELNRKSAVFALTFNDAFDERVLREVAARSGATEPAQPTAWDALSLVEDHEVEVQISADRFGLDIAHRCEWELRELDAYVGSLLGTGTGAGALERNPLRPEIVGQAMIRAIEAVSDRADLRKVLSTEIARSLGGLMASTYAEIVADMRGAGVQPLSLAVRHRSMRADGGSVATEYDTLGRPLDPPAAPRSGHGASGASRSLGGREDDSRHGGGRSLSGGAGGRATAGGTGGGGGRSSFGGSTHSGARSSWRGGVSGGSGGGAGAGTLLGSVDPALMMLMRRLAYAEAAAGTGGEGYSNYDTVPGAPLPNVIRAHRDELRQASRGGLDHMVIDVIGMLFDQILADPKVSPQMARQIARLQLPVLRAALGDPGFFASRRHPVRRFVNRIASLGAAFDDYADESAQGFLAKVRELVNEVVEGDFDQIETYEDKLKALEQYSAEAAQGGAAAELLAEKEDEARLHALYAQRLEGDLKTISAPEFVREFISRVWSQVLLRAAEQGGADGERVRRMRHAGRELFISVQPKASPAHRKTFLAELPKLMRELTEGMNLIGWPEAERRAFFGRLMPAHAEALKSTAVRQLDLNLMARQVEGVLDKALPSRAELKRAVGALPVLTEAIEPPRFTPEEAARVGLVDEQSVDWRAAPAPDPERQAEEAELAQAAATPAAEGSPINAIAPAGDAAEPTQGRDLAAEVQIGFAYQMQLEGQWQKVRLSHVSAGRSFYVFTRGQRHQRTVSLTHRMLVRLCDTGRLRAYESAYLLDRATARARRQLGELGSRS